MDTFYIIVLSIALMLLIIILTYIGIHMKSTASKAGTYPPMQATCPDYWGTQTVGSGSEAAIACTIPASTARNYPLSGFNTGTPGYGSGAIKFTDPGWSASGSAVCAQKKWANQYNVVWDGISNYNGC